MKLSIISLNFRKPDLTTTSMQTLFHAYKKQFENKEFEYIVVDNHSEDESKKILSEQVKKYPGFSYIESPKNNGFGAGNNVGAQKAEGEYLLFLNNDTQIHGNSLLEMVQFLDTHHEVGIVGGELKNFDGTPQPSVGKFFRLIPLVLLLVGMQRFGVTDKNPNAIQEVEWVKGALLMIRKELFYKLKGFDERIFMYTEDMELCFRAWKLGAKVYFYPTEGILHKDQGSSNRTFAIVHIYKGILYFYKKHMPRWQVEAAKALLISKATILLIAGKIVHNSYLSSTYAQVLSVLR